MWQLIVLSVIQALGLALVQFTMKVGLDRMPPFGWNGIFFGSLLTNYWIMLSGVLFSGVSMLWFYILRHYPLSMAYPLASLSYVFGILLAIVFLHEEVSWTRWLGIVLITTGCIFVTAK